MAKTGKQRTTKSERITGNADVAPTGRSVDVPNSIVEEQVSKTVETFSEIKQDVATNSDSNVAQLSDVVGEIERTETTQNFALTIHRMQVRRRDRSVVCAVSLPLEAAPTHFKPGAYLHSPKARWLIVDHDRVRGPDSVIGVIIRFVNGEVDLADGIKLTLAEPKI